MCHLADTRILLYQGGEHGCTPGSAPSENFLKTLTKSLDVGITGVYSPRLYTNVVDKVDKRRVETMEFSGNGSRGGKTMGDRPNVVVIVADTFRRDHLGAYGNPRIRTPHLDEFARSAVVFDHHVVSSFPTMPARADILTGTFSYTHMGWEPLPRHLQTLPELLSRAGYLTMGVVDTPFFIRNGFGYDRGFDDFVWVRGQGDDTRPHERADARGMWRSEEDRIVARTMTEAERWLERHYDEQFFPCYGDWREAGLSEDDVDLGHATYCGEVTMVDFWIGRLLAKLDVLGLRENTLVFFTSDHGFYFGEHGYFGKAEWINTLDVGTIAIAEDATLSGWLSESWLLTVGWSP